MEKYNPASERFDYCMNHLDEVDYALEIGAEKAKKVANKVLEMVREKVGY